MCGQTSLHLYRNNWPVASFTNVTATLGVTQQGIRDARIVDLNHDGIYELVRLTSGRFEVSTRSGNLGPWSGTSYSFALSQGESLATGDFNGDHLSDVFIVAQKGTDAKDDPDYLVTQTLPLQLRTPQHGGHQRLGG